MTKTLLAGALMSVSAIAAGSTFECEFTGSDGNTSSNGNHIFLKHGQTFGVSIPGVVTRAPEDEERCSIEVVPSSIVNPYQYSALVRNVSSAPFAVQSVDLTFVDINNPLFEGSTKEFPFWKLEFTSNTSAIAEIRLTLEPEEQRVRVDSTYWGSSQLTSSGYLAYGFLDAASANPNEPCADFDIKRVEPNVWRVSLTCAPPNVPATTNHVLLYVPDLVSPDRVVTGVLSPSGAPGFYTFEYFARPAQ